MQGRKPKPTVLKRLAGNPGRRPLNDAEPKPPVASINVPRYLDDGAKQEWRRVVKDLRAVGLLTSVDRAALEGYCMAYSLARGAQHEIEAHGVLIEGTKGGLVKNPATAVLNQALQTMRNFMSELGMSATSRSRLKVEKPDEGKTLAEMLFDGVDPNGVEE